MKTAIKKGSKIINEWISNEIATVKNVNLVKNTVDYVYKGDKVWYNSPIEQIRIVKK